MSLSKNQMVQQLVMWMIYLNYDNCTNLKVFFKIQEVVKIKYLNDALKLEVLNLTTTPISNML
jgi:hypothetical protein